MSTTSCYLEFAADLSSRLVSIAPESVDAEIRHALHRITCFFDVDCCAIFVSNGHEDGVKLAHAVDVRHRASACSVLNASHPYLRIFSDVLRNKKTLCLRTREDLPPEAEEDRAQLAQYGIKSLLLVPVSSWTSDEYLFMLASARDGPAWSEKQVAQVRLLADILASTMYRSCAQTALQRTTRDLTEAQQICRLGSWEWEVGSGRIVKIHGVDRILGIKPENQASFLELVRESDRALLQKAIDDALCNKGKRLPIEYRMHARRGDIRIIRSRFEVVRSDSGSRMIGSFHDITGVRRSEHELQQLRSQYWHADRIAHTGVLVASLAHELSQPLTAILSNAQAGLRFLSHESVDQQEIHDILADIVADDRRAREIIDTLRGMMRKQKTERERIDSTDIAHKTLALLHSEFVAQQVEVELACSGGCFVHVNRAEIEQVLLNLMLNSIESMRSQPAENRRIRLQVNRVGGDEVRVAVSDTGTGIPRDQLNSVFEAFWTTKEHGLGMGLAICRSIIEVHGGRIWTESNNGQGTTFQFSLPLAA